MNLPILLAAARAPAEARGDAGIQGRKSRPAQAGEHEGLHGPHEGILRPLLMDKPAPKWLTDGVPLLKMKDHLEERAKEMGMPAGTTSSNSPAGGGGQ